MHLKRLKREFSTANFEKFFRITPFRRSSRRCSVKIALLKNFERFTGKHLPSGLQVYYKETPTQVFSCEYCEIFQNSYFEEHMQTTASDSYKASVNCWFLLIQYSKIFAKVFKQCVCKVFRKNVHQWWVSGRNKL